MPKGQTFHECHWTHYLLWAYYDAEITKMASRLEYKSLLASSEDYIQMSDEAFLSNQML